jgi:hypothetical protein
MAVGENGWMACDNTRFNSSHHDNQLSGFLPAAVCFLLPYFVAVEN